MALVEWHVTPEYINRHWTEELFAFMFMRRNDRIRKNNEKIASARGDKRPTHRFIDNAEFFRRHGIVVREHK